MTSASAGVDVFLDARRAAWNPHSGTGVYATQLLRALPVVAPDLRFGALTDSAAVDMSTNETRMARWPRKAASDFVEFPWRARRARMRHVLYPEASVSGGPIVATVHDLVVYDPAANEGRTHTYYRWRHERSIAAAARVICPSQATADAVRRLHPSAPIRVVHLGIDVPDVEADVEVDASDGFLLYTGGANPRKNLATLLDAWATISTWFDGELIVTGPADAYGDLPDGVRATGVVGRDELWDLYRHATAVVYPSTSEGFGFPILEAALLGVPVVTGAVGIVPELDDHLVRVVDQRSPAAIASAVREITEGWRPCPRAVTAARAHFTWERCAAETGDVYRECL